jgi:MFS family permease
MVIVFLSSFASALIEPIYLIFLKHKFDLSVVGLALAFFPAGLVYAFVPRYAGKLSDRYGRALIIACGAVLAGLVSGGLPWMPSIWFVALFYVLFAVGWATAGPAEDALVSDLAPVDQRGRVIGAKEAAAGVGAALGPLGGGIIFEHVTQEATFVLNGSLLLLTAALTWFWFRSYPAR